MASFDRYRPSGKCAIPTLLCAFGVGVAAALILGFLYQTFVAWNPFFLFDLLAVPMLSMRAGALVLIALALGCPAAAVLKRGNCRSPVAACAVGALCGLIADAVAFKFSYDQFTESTVEVFYDAIEGLESHHPDAVERLAVEREAVERELRAGRGKTFFIPTRAIHEKSGVARYLEFKHEFGWLIGGAYRRLTGIYVRDRLTVRGYWVWLVWFLEAAVLAGLPALLARSVARTPFCEACGRWTEKRILPPRMGVDPDFMRSAAASGDLSSLVSPHRGEGTGYCACYVLRACSRCQGTAYVTVKLVGKGMLGKERVLVRDVVLPRGQIPAPWIS